MECQPFIDLKTANLTKIVYTCYSSISYCDSYFMITSVCADFFFSVGKVSLPPYLSIHYSSPKVLDKQMKKKMSRNIKEYFEEIKIGTSIST